MDPVFEIEALLKRVLELLRRQGGFMSTGSVADSLEVPCWAATSALDAAHRSGMVEHASGVGWRALSQEPARPVEADNDQPRLGLGVRP